MMKPCRQLIAGMTHLQVSQPDSGACSTQRIFSTEIRMHDEIVQPVCCWQDALTGVRKLCDGILGFSTECNFSTEICTHDEVMQSR